MPSFETITVYKGDERRVVNESDVRDWLKDGWVTIKGQEETQQQETQEQVQPEAADDFSSMSREQLVEAAVATDIPDANRFTDNQLRQILTQRRRQQQATS